MGGGVRGGGGGGGGAAVGELELQAWGPGFRVSGSGFWAQKFHNRYGIETYIIKQHGFLLMIV